MCLIVCLNLIREEGGVDWPEKSAMCEQNIKKLQAENEHVREQIVNYKQPATCIAVKADLQSILNEQEKKDKKYKEKIKVALQGHNFSYSFRTHKDGT